MINIPQINIQKTRSLSWVPYSCILQQDNWHINLSDVLEMLCFSCPLESHVIQNLWLCSKTTLQRLAFSWKELNVGLWTYLASAVKSKAPCAPLTHCKTPLSGSHDTRAGSDLKWSLLTMICGLRNYTVQQSYPFTITLQTNDGF